MPVAPPSPTGWSDPPPPPPQKGLFDRSPTGLKARRWIGRVAACGAAVLASVWLLSWIGSVPTARVWPALVVPAAALVMVPFALVVLDAVVRQGVKNKQQPQLPVHGWRVVVLGVVGATILLSVFFGPRGDMPAGTPYEDGGRSYTRVHDVSSTETYEISEHEWRAYQAFTSRFIAGVLLVFGTLATLALTEPVGEDERRREAKIADRLAGPRPTTTPSTAGAIFGRGHLAATVAMPVDAVLARLCVDMGVRATEPDRAGRVRVVGDWSMPMRFPLKTFPLFVDAELLPTGSSTMVDASVEPATTAGRLMPLQVLWGLVMIGIAAFIFRPVVGEGPPVGLILAFWAAWVMVITGMAASAPWRAQRRAIASLRGSLDPAAVGTAQFPR